MTEPTRISLDGLPNLSPFPGATMRRFGGERVMLQEARMPKGTRFEPHSHHNEQLVLVLEGRLRLDVGDGTGAFRAVELGAGDMLLLPPHIPHGGAALEDCRLVDAFSPPRTTVLGEAEPQEEPGA